MGDEDSKGYCSDVRSTVRTSKSAGARWLDLELRCESQPDKRRRENPWIGGADNYSLDDGES